MTDPFRQALPPIGLPPLASWANHPHRSPAMQTEQSPIGTHGHSLQIYGGHPIYDPHNPPLPLQQPPHQYAQQPMMLQPNSGFHTSVDPSHHAPPMGSSPSPVLPYPQLQNPLQTPAALQYPVPNSAQVQAWLQMQMQMQMNMKLQADMQSRSQADAQHSFQVPHQPYPQTHFHARPHQRDVVVGLPLSLSDPSIAPRTQAFLHEAVRYHVESSSDQVLSGEKYTSTATPELKRKIESHQAIKENSPKKDQTSVTADQRQSGRPTNSMKDQMQGRSPPKHVDRKMTHQIQVHQLHRATTSGDIGEDCERFDSNQGQEIQDRSQAKRPKPSDISLEPIPTGHYQDARQSTTTSSMTSPLERTDHNVAFSDYMCKWRVPNFKKSTPEGNESEKKSPKPRVRSRDINGFIAFTMENRAKLRQENPFESNQTILKMLGERWRTCDAAEKKKYLELAKNLSEEPPKN
eukprot:TRINITY_DN2157_c0_g5_i1.p1 TRINITY_DN2157_c0_g5~~TRINITY_DN2157_c0_g5_i1.p1  ORF type:complete len:462 (-),score=90.04 TRINITY_DN2157_c0_g5_i1:744-2129(-)